MQSLLMLQRYALAFLTTFTDTEHINRFVSSVSENNHQVSLCVVLLQQNGCRVSVDDLQTPYTKFILLELPGQVGISAARNHMLHYVKTNIEVEYIMFPDDDSTYDISFFEHFGAAPCGNKLIQVKNADRGGFFLRLPKLSKLDKKNYSLAISVNQILTWETILRTGLFDERLGAGAQYGAAEDNDYFIRALAIAPFTLAPELYNMHPSKVNLSTTYAWRPLVKRFHHYGRGIIYMLCKHQMYGYALSISVRALMGCILRLFQLNLKMSLVYLVAFYSRLSLFCRILLYRKRFYDDNSKHCNL